MENKNRKIEIIDIDLGIDIHEQIKRYADIGRDNTNNINSILEKAKEKNMKIVDENVTAKFEPLFVKLSATKTITKDEFASFLGLQPLMIAPTISKFNKFLKESKDNKFKFAVDKNSTTVKQYELTNL